MNITHEARTAQPIPGEEILIQSLGELKIVNGFQPPESLNPQLEEFLKLALHEDPSKLSGLFFADQGTVTDLSGVALMHGENVTALYKVYPANVVRKGPSGLKSGFIMTVVRSNKNSTAEIYIRDQDQLPKFEYSLRASEQSGQMIISLELTSGVDFKTQQYSAA
ncbi:hypothetical protein C4579_01325 [Candidatus Microgenomates bacterium]|nr:MAG: hypothetical protein C4579_01325 [Candidatus Microgenomates bacterium]